MDIRIFGFTVRLEIIIITLIIGMIMGGHMLCACAKVPLSEAFSLNGLGGMEGMEGQDAAAAASGSGSAAAALTNPHSNSSDSVDASGEPASQDGSSSTAPAPANVPKPGGASKNGAEKINAGSVAAMTSLIPQALGGFQNILSGLTSAGAHAPPNETKDAFTDYSDYKSGDNNSDIASSWINKAGSYSKNLGYQTTAGKSNMYAGTRVPLPEGELFFFQNNQFKPECCPSPYSSTTGCACMSSEQIAYLNTRGGNRTSDSEF